MGGWLGGWVAGSNWNKANLSPAESGARYSLAKRLDTLQKITIPVRLTRSGWCGKVGWIHWI